MKKMFKKMYMGLLLDVKYVEFSSVTNLVYPVVEEELGLMLPY